MIAWTTARLVPFEQVCTASYSEATNYTSAFTEDIGGGVINNVIEGSGSTFQSQSGQTVNATGVTSSSSEYYTEFSSGFASYTLSNNVTTFTQSGSATISSYSTSASASGSSSAGAVGVQTTTASTFSEEVVTTSSSEGDSNIWTSSISTFTEGDETITTTSFYQTTATASVYFAAAGDSRTRATTILTETGTTLGNVFDTIYQAAPDEVLYSINDSPQYYQSKLHENAQSGTRFTVSAQNVNIDLIATSASQSAETIESSEATTQYNVKAPLASSVTQTTAFSLINAETSTQLFAVTSSQSASSSEVISGQNQITHYGNTFTQPITYQEIRTQSKTDVLASVQHEVLWRYNTFGTVTGADNNVVASYTTAGEGFSGAGGCAGDMVVLRQKEVGSSALGPEPVMAIYCSRGAKIDGEAGARLTADEQSLFAPIVEDGGSTSFATLFPVSNSTMTVEKGSVTIQTTTNDDEFTTTSYLVGVDGSPWIALREARAGLLGGNLQENETGLMRNGPGLYQNQSGGVSFFSGNDTTYTGAMETTFWQAVSYVVPNVGHEYVFAVPRNTSTWPT
jgi:hypothetical protein